MIQRITDLHDLIQIPRSFEYDGVTYHRLYGPGTEALKARFLEEAHCHGNSDNHVGGMFGKTVFAIAVDSDGHIIGLATEEMDDEEWEHYLSVDTGHQRQGIGLVLTLMASAYCALQNILFCFEPATEDGHLFANGLVERCPYALQRDFDRLEEVYPGSLLGELTGRRAMEAA